MAIITALAAWPATAAESGYREPRFAEVIVDGDIGYRTTTDASGELVELGLDTYAPLGDESASRPAMLLLHGGAFLPQFDRRQPHLVELARAFAKRGWVVVAPDYRTRQSPMADPMGVLRDAVDDGRGAFDWVRTNAAARGVDPDRIAVVGSSAGAIVGTSLVGLENSAAQRCGRVGVFAFVSLWGSPVQAYRLCNFDSGYPPTLVIHGTADAVVPFANAEVMIRELERSRVDAELFALADAPHTPIAHADAVVSRMADFLAKRMPP